MSKPIAANLTSLVSHLCWAVSGNLVWTGPRRRRGGGRTCLLRVVLGQPPRWFWRSLRLTGAPFWPWCLWRLCGAVVPGATGTLPYNGRVGGRLDAWRGLVGRWCYHASVSMVTLAKHRSPKNSVVPPTRYIVAATRLAGRQQELRPETSRVPRCRRRPCRLHCQVQPRARLLQKSCRRAGQPRKKW